MKFIKRILALLIVASLLIISMGVLWRVRQEPLASEEVTRAVGIPYTIDSIPISNKRPGTKRQIRYIVIHNTANPDSTARNERDYLTNPNNASNTSFHIVVDENEIIEAIPVTELAFHAGTREGNEKGIGIEICETGNQQKTEENATRLIAYLMKTYNIPLERVITHKDCSGKECPRLILNHWGHFTESINETYKDMK